MDITFEQAEQAIKTGVMNEVTVAYFLMLDHKMKMIMRDQYTKKEDKKSWPSLSTSPPPSHFSIEMVMGQNNSLDDRDSFLRERLLPSVSANEEFKLDSAQVIASKWQLGIKCENKNLNGTDIMLQTFKVLKSLDMVRFHTSL